CVVSIDPRLRTIVAAQPFPLVFSTISGAHLYGFPSPDSDFDLRGAHVLPLEKVVGLDVRNETVEDSRVIEGLEMDIVSHDVRKVHRPAAQEEWLRVGAALFAAHRPHDPGARGIE